MMIVDVDGHISALQVIGGESYSPDAKKACFELLISIASKSRAGRDAICDSEGCMSCIEYASDCINNLAMKYSKDEATEMEQLQIVDDKTSSFHIELAAISFLSCLVRNKTARDSILSDAELEVSIETLAKDADLYEVQYSAIAFLGFCARHIQYEEGDAEQYEELFGTVLSIIETSQVRTKSRQVDKSSGLSSFGDFKKSHHFNENLVLASSCRVIESLMPILSMESVSKAVAALSKLWNGAINFQALSSKRAASKCSNSGILMYNMSSIFLLAIGRSETQAIMKSPEILKSLLRLILFDQTKIEKQNKTEQGDNVAFNDSVHWRGALAQSLQCVAALTDNASFGNNEGAEKSWEEFISGVEASPNSSNGPIKMRSFTLSKQNSLPSRTIKTSLETIESNISDSASSIAATRILENLFG